MRFGILLFWAMVLPASAEIRILHNASIHSLDPETPTARAMAYDDDGVVALGSLEALTRRFPQARQQDLGGATVVPGLIDAHAHLMNLGLGLMRADLTGTRSKEAVIERLTDFEHSLPESAWLLGRGWDQNDWPDTEYPSRADLDAHFPDRPVWLMRVDGHAGWANSVAMSRTDRDLDRMPHPEGGEILRDATGQATGIFIDNAMDLIRDQIPDPSPAENEEALRRALARAAQVGLTGVHEAGTKLEWLRLYQAFDRRGEFTLRIYAMADGEGEAFEMLCRDGPVGEAGDRVVMRSLKLYADGALGSRGAALLAPYADQSGHVGLMRTDEDRLAKQIEVAMGCGLQVNVHAIGDRANRVVLDALAAGIRRHPDNPGRHRIEHAQVVSPDDLGRFGRLGIIASMQPTHATSDMYWAEQRLGRERLAGAYAWRTLLDGGARLALGSDFPVEQPEPLLGLYAAITRQDAEGWPEGGWLPEQRLTAAEALHGFTLGAAYAGFAEAKVGSLSPGKMADFVVLSQDPLAGPPSALLDTRVLATVVGGRPVHAAADFESLSDR